MVGCQREILPKTTASCSVGDGYTGPHGLPGNAGPCYLADTAGKACMGGCTEEMGKQEGEKTLCLCSAV